MKKIVMLMLTCLTLFSTNVLAETTSGKDESEQLTAESTNLQSENEELKDHIKSLEEEIASLQEQVDTLTLENEKLKFGDEEKETEYEKEISPETVNVTTHTDVTTTKIVQEALNKEGYNCGTPDGIAGTKTAEAISNYQTDKGLLVNGAITDELLDSLAVADKIAEAAKKEASKAEYNSGYSYEQLARNPESYIGDKVKFSGKVLQAETGDVCYLRLAMNSDYDTVIFVTYTSDVVDYRLLEDDYVTIYGIASSTYSYEAVSGATITLPWIMADIIELQ